MNISAIDHLETYEDGDVITPGMGVSLPEGQGMVQYFNPSTGICTPDYTDTSKQIILYPQAYSSSVGSFVVPDIEVMQWYLNTPEIDSAAILDDNGNVKSIYADRFEKTTYTVNNKTFPAIKIIGNLASSTSLSDKTIYFRSTFNGKLATCKQDINIEPSTGSQFEVVVNCVNESGVNDYVIDNDTEFLILNSFFQDAGNAVVPSSYSWEKLTVNGYSPVVHSAGVTEISNGGKTLKIFESGIDGIEEYVAVITYNGKQYRKGIQVADTHDPYYVVLGRNVDSNIIGVNDTVTYTPSVKRRSDQAIQSGWAFSFLTYKNDGTVIDNTSGTTKTILGSDIKTNGGTNVKITATK